MAVWYIQTDVEQDLVRLTYLVEGKPPQPCGQGGLVLLRDLEAWVIDQASTWDRIQTERGVFVRQSNAFVRA